MLLVWKFHPEVGLLAKIGVFLSGMALLLAETGQILASLEEMLSFFHILPNWAQKKSTFC
ncbi:hypothetical protein M4D55_17135 [Metabacillus idriensis]|uniref:hypothetical protein n=1 Tax=Metabacillus idriensis TaxID=324768 RepID=UPI00204037C0|nr:hypothetical protein [Metabacillus idriensis]MCM3597498.1 hypothetical protein [Metabacillus idriensis]